MANEGKSAQIVNLNDKNLRKVRKALTRDSRGSFEVCDDHERRLRAESFDIVISHDPESKALDVRATVKVSCGHSKHPCRDTRSMIIASNTEGISSKILRAASAPDEDEDEADGVAA